MKKAKIAIGQFSHHYRKSISLAVMLLLALSAVTQDYEPTLKEGAQWTIEVGQGMGSFIFYSVRLICDTVTINGEDYNLLQVDDPANHYCNSIFGYVREDIEEKQVFFYEENYNDGVEFLVADYSLAVGDFLDPTVNSPIDSIFYLEFAGEQRKFFRFSNGYDGYFEGVGSIRYGVFPSCSGFKTLTDYQIEDECNELVNTVNVHDASDINIYPNPTDGNINIRFPDVDFTASITVEVVSADGSLITSKRIKNENTTIDLGYLPVGFYMIAIKEENRSIVTKKIIKI